jgi:hypothetical protein
MRPRSLISENTLIGFTLQCVSHAYTLHTVTYCSYQYLHMVNIGQAARLNTGLVLGDMMLPMRINIISMSF